MDLVSRRLSQLPRARLELITRLALWASFIEGLALGLLALLIAMD